MAECGKGCKHWPPSATDGKPCCYCDPSNPLMNCYEKKIQRKSKTDNPKNEQITLRLSERQRVQLKKLADKNDISEPAMLRRLIKEAFERS